MAYRILYLSRGRGYGHAIPDLVVCQALRQRSAEVELTLASYGEGIQVIEKSGFDFEKLNLDLEDEFNQAKVIPVITEVFDRVRPSLVIAHEMFFAPAISRRKGVPCIFLTHWFFSEIGREYAWMDSLIGLADRIVVLDIDRFHQPPHALAQRVQFVGPIIRTYDHMSPDSNDVQERLVIVALGGRIHAYQSTAELILRALSLTNIARKSHVVFLAPGMVDHFMEMAQSLALDRVDIVDYLPDAMAFQARATLVIGRGSYNVMAELAVLGTPSLQIINDDNPVDTLHARNFELLGTAKVVHATMHTQQSLAQEIDKVIQWASQNREAVWEAGRVYRTARATDEMVSTVLDFLSSSRGLSN